MAPLDVLCLVTGAGGLEPDAAALLAGALERAGGIASLASGGPAVRGAAPAAAGRNLALCRYSAAEGLQQLYPPSAAPLDLRRWALAARACATPPPFAAAPGAAPRAGGSAALDALAALLEQRADAEWLAALTPEGAQLTIVAPAPAAHVDEDLLSPLMEAANARLLGVCFAAVAPPMGACLGLSVESELRAKHASLSLAAAVAAADNGSFRGVPCTPGAADALALALLLPERTAAGAPRVDAELVLPAPLTPGGARKVRVALRADVLPLHDGVAQVKVCACHGHAVLSKESPIGCDDIGHMLLLAGKNNCCSVSAKALTPEQWHPNCLAVGRDAVIHLPSFYAPPFALSCALARDAPPAAFAALACVPLSAVSESHLFGMPWTARPADEDDDDDADDGDDAGGAPSNAVLLAALCGALAARGSGMLLASQHNLDTGASTPFRCLYLAIPAAAPPTPPPTAAAAAAAAADGGVDRAAQHDATPQQQPPTQQPPAQLLLKRIVAKEELLPPPPAAAAPAVPPAVAADVARALAATLPDTVGAFDPLALERGAHRILAPLISKSLAPPPRGATHVAEADAMQARERAAARKPAAGKQRK